MKIRKNKWIIILMMACIVVVAGCSVEESDTKINISFSEFKGVYEKEINLNEYDNELNLSGTIKLKAGEILLSIRAKDSGEVLYEQEITEQNAGSTKIDIEDLDNNSNLLLTVESQSVENLKISLTSKQKWVKDKIKPDR
jgi:hypothetical protein